MTRFGALRRRCSASAAAVAALLVPLVANACAGPGRAAMSPYPAAAEPAPIEMGLPPDPGRYEGGLDVLHYDIEIVILPENDRIAGRTTIRYLSHTQGPHPVVLDFTGLAVDSVVWDGDPIAFEHENGEIRFTAPGAASVTDTLEVEVRTRGTPDDGLILRNTVHGEPAAFADNWPNRARFWFPSVDHPSDKATVGFTVHAPEGRGVIANGVLVNDPVAADPALTGGVPGLVTWRWENRVPIPTYLMVIGAAEMAVLDGGMAACGQAPASPRPDGCIEVTAWAFRPDTANARRAFARSAEMIDFYTEVVGPYPFEKLANVQSATRFGGMENASAIFYSEEALAAGRDIEGTVAHEIAHQWFGNSVTPADWHHLWLSEGFASYFGPLFYEHVDGADAFRDRIAANRERYLGSEVTGRPVVDDGVDNLMHLLNANSYQKGSLVLHMLRWVMGDDAFFDGVRRYYARHAGGNADTGDLRRALEEVHGEPLDWFFQQWLLEPGYPVYRVDWSWDASRGEVEITVRQEQDAAWPTFRMPVEIELELADGPERVVRRVDGRRWTERIPLASPPSGLRIDPDGWLLARIDYER